MRNSASPTKSPSKSALRGRTLELTPAKALAQKRGVVFSQETLSGPDDDLQPETPSKRRRVESPIKATGHTPHKRSHLVTPTSTSAFHLALSGTIHHAPPTEEPSPFLSTVNKIPPPVSSPSTPRRTRKPQSTPAEPSYAMDVDEPEQHAQPSRRRFRPIFLDSKQWCSRDPKLEAIWARAQRHVEGMTSLYGNPLQKYGHQHTAAT
ncbi:hypothetical protein SERLADRAFT_470899 [Serpula lacrymans var. lacrymans S7.9]|nr:uncharacterized protein SERLADRAFT_470899 [Serpula lacrymans var. lacrymans S7.9]EGO24124.1 hypothetical protein SERLADRAFT_470899 [Serpula lacrymans var. lacrymans S7.9]